MPQEGPSADRLDSWKEIAAYVGRDVRTVIRWEQRGGLPVYRIPVGQRQAVYAFRHEIDEWMAGGTPGSMDLGAALEVAATRPDWNRAESFAASPAAAEVSTRDLRPPLRLVLGLAAACVAAVLLTAFVFIMLRTFTPPDIALDNETQITGDGAIKRGLVTDGSMLYFSELREGRVLLSKVPIEGGPVREIPTPFIQAEPMDVSHDGQRLLILAGEGEEHERTLWILNTDGKNPRRVGDLLCHAAAWSPDTRRIAYALGSSLYEISTDNAGGARIVHTFAGIPLLIRWSLDGKRLFVVIRNSSTWNAAIWQIVLNGDDGSFVGSLAPASLVSRDYNALAILDSNDDAFVGTGKTIWILRRKRWPWQSGFLFAQLSISLRGHDSFATDLASRRLFVTREAHASDELDRFDRTSHEFRPFLPGISARDVDFSRDGRRIVYFREPDNTLWVSQADGTAGRQMATPGIVSIELPRWSPDGERIAFMGKLVDAPYRIFVVSANGGPLTEASHGTDNQGAPTWSMDGQRLVYGRVQCQEEKTCRLQQIDLNTGEQTMISGSEGLSTARWSPDGHFIAALRADRHEVWLRDLRSATWRKLADGANGNDLTWSPDSRTVYASRPNGDRPEVIRISVHNGKVEPVVDLSDFSKLSGRIDTWFAVTPDDSILFLRVVSGHDIFAYHYAEK